MSLILSGGWMFISEESSGNRRERRQQQGPGPRLSHTQPGGSFDGLVRHRSIINLSSFERKGLLVLPDRLCTGLPGSLLSSQTVTQSHPYLVAISLRPISSNPTQFERQLSQRHKTGQRQLFILKRLTAQCPEWCSCYLGLLP